MRQRDGRNGERLPFEWRRNLGRLADRLSEIRADFARVRMKAAVVGRPAKWLGMLMVRATLVVMPMMMVHVTTRRGRNDCMLVMMPVLGNEVVQTFAQDRNAGVRGQQKAAQESSMP